MNMSEIKEALDDAILHDCPVHHTYVKALWDRLEGMQKTLEWYANGWNYVDGSDFKVAVIEDDGECARQALKGVPDDL